MFFNLFKRKKMPETPQPKTDVQTLLEYFDKLLGTFKALIWIASIAIAIVTAIFTAMLFEDKKEAQAKVVEAEGKAERAFAKADSLIKNASKSIDETEADAKRGIASVSEVAEREISNLKSIARQRASEEVDRFVKSNEIQNLIDTKVRKEIEGSYFEEVNELTEITFAYDEMLLEEYNGMLVLQKYSNNARNPLTRRFASNLLDKGGSLIMKKVWPDFPDYSSFKNRESANDIKAGSDNVLKFLSNLNNDPSIKPNLTELANMIHSINGMHGKNYSVSDLKEVEKFLKTIK